MDTEATAERVQNPAEIIRDQLGRGALFMMGAKDLVSLNGGKTLAFKIGRNAKGVSYVQIALQPDDTYTVTFFKVRKHVATKLHEDTFVYADNLHRVIESATGLYLSL